MVYGFTFYIEYGEVGMETIEEEQRQELVNDFCYEVSPTIRENIKKYFTSEIKINNIHEDTIDMEISYALERLLSTLRI